jgi:hypothetical protein
VDLDFEFWECDDDDDVFFEDALSRWDELEEDQRDGCV